MKKKIKVINLHQLQRFFRFSSFPFQFKSIFSRPTSEKYLSSSTAKLYLLDDVYIRGSFLANSMAASPVIRQTSSGDEKGSVRLLL